MTAVLERELRAAASDGRIPCARVHAILGEHGRGDESLPALLDRLGLKVIRCQLGLFGGKKASEVAPPDEALVEALRAEAPDGVLSCARAWDLATRLGRSRLDVGRAARDQGLRIVSCGLGLF